MPTLTALRLVANRVSLSRHAGARFLAGMTAGLPTEKPR